MNIEVHKTKLACSAAAADRGAEILRQAIAVRGRAGFIVATGASQFDFLKSLTQKEGIDWRLTTMYHLDEYIGFGADHPASFRRYLKERLVDVVRPGTVHFIQGEAADAAAECRIRRRILKRRCRTLLCSWMRLAGGSNSVRDGLHRWKKCRQQPYRCR